MVARIEWQQLTAKEMGDSRYILEVNSGLSDGLEVWLEVREVPGIIRGSAYGAA